MSVPRAPKSGAGNSAATASPERATPRGKPKGNAAKKAKPFLKWVGGKGQLLDRLSQLFPAALAQGKINAYHEPFLGGGAMFFHVMQNYPVKKAFLRDVNPELVLAYQVVQRDVGRLVERLGRMERDYLKLDETRRKVHYLKVREAFNTQLAGMDFKKYSDAWVARAAQILFLNKTCYNGLFRVNQRGGFNVPVGRYARPSILDEENLVAASSVLAKAEIRLGDFAEAPGLDKRVSAGSFIYFDPPYRPISQTARFTAYSAMQFGDDAQARLAELFHALDRPGVYQMLSNSDPKNTDPSDEFFEKLYAKYGSLIRRIPATRSINSDATRRGPINEIVITNYRS